MLNYLTEKFPELMNRLADYAYLLTPISVPAKTVLLAEGQISKKAYYVQKGCLRAWFNQDGKEITFQFYFEGQAIASLESFLTAQPSLYYIETVEPSTLSYLQRNDFDELLTRFPELKDALLDVAFHRMSDYQKLFLSWIRTNPRQRYVELLASHPQIVQRIPQQYIASYLGITPVSLSRLRRTI